MIYKKKRGTLQPNPNSLVLDLKPILAIRNIKFPSAYFLKLGLSSSTISKLLKGEMVQINFRQLTLLCTSLNCTPNDIIARRNLNLPPEHELNKLPELSTTEEVLSVEEWLKDQSLEDLKGLLLASKKTSAT